MYPLTKVQIGVGNFHREVEAAVSSTLPMPVLLGRDVNLSDILQETQENTTDREKEDNLAVITRARSKQLERQERDEKEKEVADGAQPKPADPTTTVPTIGVETSTRDSDGWTSGPKEDDRPSATAVLLANSVPGREGVIPHLSRVPEDSKGEKGSCPYGATTNCGGAVPQDRY